MMFSCVISTMCVQNLEFQRVNPTTQVALFSVCTGTCISDKNITWNIYQGFSNGSLQSVQWYRFNQINQYENIWFFGRILSVYIYSIDFYLYLGTNTSNFTAINRLFLDNSEIEYWRFEVVYSFSSEISSSALNFVLNQPPSNGSCMINPLNGTTSTLFNISCRNWSDQDDIKDYSFYSQTFFDSCLFNENKCFVSIVWTTDRSKLSVIIVFQQYQIFDFDCLLEIAVHH